MSAPTASASPAPAKTRRVNVRTPEVMERVQAEVETHYRSVLVENLRKAGGVLSVGNTTIRLARDFGFCYGVERAIDLAYAARRVFADRKVYLLGEIIHNPEVNRQLQEMGIISIPISEHEATLSKLNPEDVVIVPAFGAETRLMNIISERGCSVVDTTCGDVMSVWKRVRGYAKQGFTSIIHGKAEHEETRATSSRAMGDSGDGTSSWSSRWMTWTTSATTSARVAIGRSSSIALPCLPPRDSTRTSISRVWVWPTRPRC